ncbi:MAG: cell division protein FtsH, partial [Treponema sp.]|nr:cell division protein FtsH [Treponema sp.]
MSQDDDKKNRDPNDPYNFFKLSVDPDDKDEKKKAPKNGGKFPLFTIIFLLIAAILVANMFMRSESDADTVDFSEFREKITKHEIDTVILGDSYFIGYKDDGSPAKTYSGLDYLLMRAPKTERVEYKTVGIISDEFLDLLNSSGVKYRRETRQNSVLLQILINCIPFIILIAVYIFLFRKMSGGLGGMGSVFGIGGGKSKAVDEGKVKTRFADVAGVDEAKEELVEVVDFLKQPKKYTEIGGKIPKGVLLVGP